MTDIALYQAPSTSSTAGLWKALKAWVRSNLRGGKHPEDHASFRMLHLSRANLTVRLRSIDESSLVSDSQRKIYATVAEMLKVLAKAGGTATDLAWDEIYKAESLIALLYNGAQLRQEIASGLYELAKVNQAEANALRHEFEQQFGRPVDDRSPGLDDSILRAFLLRVLETIHWNEKKKYLARPVRVQATNRILLCLLVSFGLLIIPYIYLIWDFKDSSVHKIWSLFALYTALTAGLLGAFSSRLNGIQRQWADMCLDEVFLQREWSYTLLRAGVGVCGALVAYFFLRSGIAEGALFPKFQEIRIELIDVTADGAIPMAFGMPSKSLSLLTFWCFLAGFSETLVARILKDSEQEFSNAASAGQTSRK
jgi:hypothetical protein